MIDARFDEIIDALHSERTSIGEAAVMTIHGLIQERDAAIARAEKAEAGAAAMREALTKIYDVNNKREAFVMRGAFAMHDMAVIAWHALASDAGAALLERLRKAEGERDKLRKLCGEAAELLEIDEIGSDGWVLAHQLNEAADGK
jgi:hypothetical protein